MRQALITGASSGIGEAVALQLAKKGVRLLLSGRDEKRLETLAEKLGSAVEGVIVADLLKRAPLIETIRSSAPDLLINNAGFGLYGKSVEIPIDEQLALLEVDGAAVMELTLEASRALIAAGKEGVIMNISSVAGEMPMPGMAVYGAAKSFVTSFSEAVDFELRNTGVRVLVNCPGMVATGFATRAAKKAVAPFSGKVMSVEYAAKKIVSQIEKGRGKQIISPFYRWSTWVVKHLAPSHVVKRMIEESILKRL